MPVIISHLCLLLRNQRLAVVLSSLLEFKLLKNFKEKRVAL